MKKMPNKVINPAPIIKELADWCLKAKGLECSVLGKVIDMLKAAPAAEVVKWIPVTERLPGFEIERVLVMTKGNFILGYPKMDTDRYINGRWVRYGDNVTHWMPLPEPPEEDE